MPTEASEVAGKAGAKPAALVVTDEEGRRLTRTMRRSDQLQVLMDFYYSMVPSVKHGEGIFNYRGPQLNESGMKTPADYRMEDGDEIRFFPEVELVTTVPRDFTGRSFTRTMRSTDRLQVLMDFYHDMVPGAAVAPGVFLYRGERVTGEHTPAGLGMKDWDRIYVVPTSRGVVVQKKQSDEYITLKVQDQYGRRVWCTTMRRTQKLEALMDLFRATVPDGVYLCGGKFQFEGRPLRRDQTPAQLKMEDGDEVDYFS